MLKSLYVAALIFFISIESTFQQQLTEDQKKAVVRLQVFTVENLTKTIELNNSLRDDQLKSQLKTICDPVKKPLTKFIVHGFAETWNMTYRWNWVNDMKKELLKSSDSDKMCLIILDWKELAKGGDLISNYWKAISNMNLAADLMVKFFSLNKIDENKMHCIGFSLGCHMCSIFYKVYQTKLKIKPYRITGLDPAGPFFHEKPLSEKLNYNDAQFVDILHTSENFGLADKLGHMDFFVDDGPSEVTACSNIKDRFDTSDKFILYEETNKKSSSYADVYIEDKDLDKSGGLSNLSLDKVFNFAKRFFNSVMDFFKNKPKRIFLNLHAFFGCSHLMSVRLFIFSINECNYKVSYCNSTNTNDFKKGNCSQLNDLSPPRMGYYADSSDVYFKYSMASFFTNTTSTPPFCKDPISKTRILKTRNFV